MRTSICMHVDKDTNYSTSKLYAIEGNPPTPVINIDEATIFFSSKQEVERFKKYIEELLGKLEVEL